jgi:6-phosphogluconolactonase
MNPTPNNKTTRPGWRRYVPVAACAAVFAAAPPAQADPFVYVTNPFGEVFQFGVEFGGTLSPLATPTVAAGAHPAGVAVSADAQSVYVADGGPGGRAASVVLQYDVGVVGDGLLSPKSTASVAAGPDPGGFAVSSDNRSVYVGDSSSAVYEYDVGPGGALFPKRGQASVALDGGQQVVSVAESPDRSSLYVTSSNYLPGDGWIYQYDVELGGVLSPKSTPKVALGFPPSAMAVHPDGKSAYVGNTANNTLVQFDIDATTGALTPKAAAPPGTGELPSQAAVSPDGTSLYVANLGVPQRAGGDPGSVTQYDIDATTGALSPKDSSTAPAGSNPVGVVVSPDGGSVYVSNLQRAAGGGGTVSQYNIAGDGTLHPMDPPSLPLSPYGTGGLLAVSPILPTPGPDLLVGTAGPNVICGLGGSDTIKGLGGDDKLYGDRCGGRASAARSGALGARRARHDVLLGGAGRDRLYGGVGRDRLRGGRGRDRLRGGPGRDRLHVRGGGRDRVHCGDGRDMVIADQRDTVRRCERIIRR